MTKAETSVELNSFSGKNAVVTGASTGIGREIAKMIATNGGRVALLARSTGRLNETKKIIADSGGLSDVFVVDLRRDSDIDRTAAEILKRYDSVDIIVNAAGVWHDQNVVYAGRLLSDTPEEQVKEVLEVGVQAPFLLTRSLLPPMMKRKQGKILNISGTFESGPSGWLHYYVSKKAIEHFTIGLAEELRPYLIQVNAISPSDTYTEAYQKFFSSTAKELAQPPSEIAKIARVLLSSYADNVTGQVIVVRSKFAH